MKALICLMKRAIVYVVNFQNWIIEQHNRASYPPLFVKNIHIFYLKDFFCFNFPNLKAPLTLRFNKLSYLKQWSEQNIGWLHALFLLPTSFESNIFNVKQELILKKLHWKIKVQKAWIWVFNKFVHFICFEYTRLISWDSFFFFTFEIQKQQSC